jgi:hypothetical protein
LVEAIPSEDAAVVCMLEASRAPSGAHFLPKPIDQVRDGYCIPLVSRRRLAMTLALLW